MTAALPNSGKLGKPHIESKARTLKKDLQNVHDMFNGSSTSGFGWDEINKPLTAYDDAHGNGAKDCGDVEKDVHIKVLESDEEIEMVMESSHDAPRKTNAQVKDNTNIEVDETTIVGIKGKDKLIHLLMD
ncbi:hypothetical protein CTI12_AA480840 [Artemisia annua]|uniref:Myb/SANT-like domain-containing protein n=1 Tax=Artemisia annua TaxID=35608 RepID=A0A2U1LKJ0_ARTAN|nr:hypothetical protein CTI12_AA480840 [Artemisia annua]